MHVKIATGNAHDEGGIGGIGKQEKNAGQVEPFDLFMSQMISSFRSRMCVRSSGWQKGQTFCVPE